MLSAQSVEFLYGIIIGYSAFCGKPINTVGSKTMCSELKQIGLTSNTLLYTESGAQGVAFADLLSCKEVEGVLGHRVIYYYTGEVK